MSEPVFDQHSVIKAIQPFLVGGVSGMVATACIHPIDMVKVRLQLAGEGSSSIPRPTAASVTRHIISQGSVLDLYQGLSAGLLRQVVYGTARLGLFYKFEEKLRQRAEKANRPTSFEERAVAGILAGALGAFVGNPTEMALIRMQSDGLNPPAQRANYRSAFDALARITRTEGVLALWRGSSPTIIRACATNFGQLTVFSESEHHLAKTDLPPQAQTIMASAIAGTFAAALSLPFDFVKTRLQRQEKTSAGTLRYEGTFDCFFKVARDEGILVFYRGLGPYYLRIAPHAVIMLTVADNITRLLSGRA